MTLQGGKWKVVFLLQRAYVKVNQVAQLAECSHGKQESLGSSPGRATIFSSL